MKKKFLKGFTLVELIVVMALMAILMAAMMQLFRPIRATFVDSTAYESQRTVQNGMVRYITESIRYATDMGFYSSSVTDAVDKFSTKYISTYNIDSSKETAVKNAIKENAEIIIIDRKETYSSGVDGNTYKGRILRRKFASGASLSDVAGSAGCRLALGNAYYGASDYSITFSGAPDSGNITDGIEVTVSSVMHDSLGGNSTVSNKGTALCLNLISGGLNLNGNAGVHSTNAGFFDKDNYTGLTDGQKLYIVFLNSDGKDKVLAVS